MEKDFIEWHHLKTRLQRRERGLFFAERQIWICSVGLNIGHEEDGRGEQFLRPVIIFKKFTSALFWGIPLTTSKRRGRFGYGFFLKGRSMIALLDQMRVFDGKRILRRSAVMPEKEFFEMGDLISGLIAKKTAPLSKEGCLGGPKSNCRNGTSPATKEIPRGAEAQSHAHFVGTPSLLSMGS